MPPFKKQAETFSWDAFPEVPAEAKDWQPDPDSIAKPGAMKDPRFNKDAHEVARLKAARDGVRPAVRYGSSLSSVHQPTGNPSSGEVTPSKALEAGKWPVQLPRHYKPASAQSTQSAQSAQSAQAPRPYKAENVQPIGAAPVTSRKPTNDQPLFSWARELEQALSEETFQGQPVDKKKASDEAVESKPRNLDEQFKSACDATRRVSNSGVAEGTGSVQGNDAVRGDTVASDSEFYETNKATADGRYQSINHYLKISLVLTMQKDLWEHDLLSLSLADLDTRLHEVSSIHEQFWYAKQAQQK